MTWFISQPISAEDSDTPQLRAAAVNLQRLTSLGLHHNGTTWAIT